MPASKRFCADQITRLNCLRDANYRLETSFKVLWEALARCAESNEEAEKAITLLLEDPLRSSDKNRNGVPEPGEIAIWVAAARGGQEGSPAVRRTGLCGLCENGWIRTVIEKRGLQYPHVAKCCCQGGKAEPSGMQLALGTENDE